MSDALVDLIMPIVAAAMGGNATVTTLKDVSLGTLGNPTVWAIGVGASGPTPKVTL